MALTLMKLLSYDNYRRNRLFLRLQFQLNTVRVVRERWEDDGTFDET